MTKEGEGKLNKQINNGHEKKETELADEIGGSNGKMIIEKVRPLEIFDRFRSKKENLGVNFQDYRLLVIWDARDEFSENMRGLIKKLVVDKANLSPDETAYFDQEAERWWQEKFGLSFFSDKKTIKQSETAVDVTKTNRMKRLQKSLNSIDAGENIEDFEGARRTIYLDENKDELFVLENGLRKEIGMGDILSDYAWNIKYVPDPEMPHLYFRYLAKKILVNEARRDIEGIYYEELGGQAQSKPASIELIFSKIRKGHTIVGFLAEHMARELCNRTGVNNDLGFLVLRVDPIEDTKYKYDFKLKTIKRRRGIAVEDKKNLSKVLRKIGVQFSVSINLEKKNLAVAKAKKKFAKELPVDDIIVVVLPQKGSDFIRAFRKWLSEDKPSGGPEQFLPRDLKIRLLKESIQGFIKITDEELDKIFPPEPAKSLEQKAV